MTSNIVTVVASGAGIGILPGAWTLGEPNETGNLFSIPLFHTSIDDEPVFIWTLTKDELLHMEPESIVWQMPQALRQKYVRDQSALEKAISRLQLEIKKPWKGLVRNWRKNKDKDSSLIELTGEKPLFVEQIAPKVPDPQPYGSNLELFERVRKYLSTYVYLKEDFEYRILTCWVALTWQLENSPVAPYLSIFAPKGHGKTRLVEALFRIVRRPLPVGYATPAGVRRALDDADATLLLDEAEMYINAWGRDKSPSNREMMAILNSGYRRDVPAIMVDPNTYEPKALQVFGCKCILSREDIFDTVQDRALEYVMPKAPHVMPDIFSPEAEAEGETIRAQFAQYRIDMLKEGRRLTSDFAKDEESRLREILEPLCAIAPPEYREAFDHILKREQTIRLQRLQDTIEYRVLDALNVVVQGFGSETFIPIESIRIEYDERYPKKDGGKTSGRTVSRVLSRLKFDGERQYNQEKKVTERGIKLDQALLDNLNLEYGFKPKSSDDSDATDDTMESTPHNNKGVPGGALILASDTSDASENQPIDFAAQADVTRKLTTYGYRESGA